MRNILENGIFRSPYDDSIPDSIYDTPLEDTILNCLREKFPDSEFIEVDENGGEIRRSWYKEVAAFAIRFKNLLTESGVTSTDIVHVVGENSIKVVSAMLGCILGNVVYSNSHFKSPWNEIDRNSRLCCSSYLVTSEAIWETVREHVCSGRSCFKGVFVLRDGERSFSARYKPEFEFIGLEKYSVGQSVDTAVLADVSSIFMSSGSTGIPKPIMLTRKGIILMLHQCAVPGFFNKDSTSVYLLIQPLAHVGGMNLSLLGHLYSGVTFVVQKHFTPNSLTSIIDKYRVSHFFAVIPVLHCVAQNTSTADLSSLRVLVTGGQVIPIALCQRVMRDSKNPELVVKNIYGMTEMTCFTATHIIGSIEPQDPESIGTLAARIQMRLVNPQSGLLAGVNEPGEMQFKSEVVTKGYLNDPEKTAAAFTEDGWFRTGDLGRYNEKNEVFVMSRIKDVIKYQGVVVAPAEVEMGLACHPAVAASCVLAKPDEVDGELPVAAVVLREGFSPDEQLKEDIIAKLRKEVHEMKVVHEVHFVSAIPTSGPLMKVNRTALKQQLGFQ